LIDSVHAEPGNHLAIEIDGELRQATTCPLPFI